MNRDELMQIVREQMPAKRWEHTLGVIDTASRLARRYGADIDKAELAAILHDVAKYWPAEALKQIIIDEQLPSELLDYNVQLWHAPVGAFIAQNELGIDDPEVLDAVRYHTSGRKGMTLLEKVVCLADYIEPGREFPEVERIRELADENINLALVACFDSTIRFLLQQGKPIFPLTIITRNELLGGKT